MFQNRRIITITEDYSFCLQITDRNTFFVEAVKKETLRFGQIKQIHNQL